MYQLITTICMHIIEPNLLQCNIDNKLILIILKRLSNWCEQSMCRSSYRRRWYGKQVIRVKKTHGAAAPHTRITWASFLGSEEPLLKLLRSAKLQHTNLSLISNCRRSKSAIFLSSYIELQYKFIVAVTCKNMYYIYIERYILEVEMKII